MYLPVIPIVALMLEAMVWYGCFTWSTSLNEGLHHDERNGLTVGCEGFKKWKFKQKGGVIWA
jgi:hypothetical protein